MADITRTIEILFKGSNQVGTVISSVNSDLDAMNFSVAAATQPLADLSAAVVKLDAALAAMASAGLAFAYNESSKLQSAFTELKKVVGDNDEALAEAKATAKDLSGVYGESAASVLESTANYVQAGFSVEESMQLARIGMDLVIAGGVQASQSSEILIATLKGFKAPAEDAGRLLDILNEVSNQYATDIEQLGVGMAGISPIARTMGFTFEETAGILTPVIEIFRSGDEAAVALKTGLLKLLDDSKPVQEALESIGVSQRDANGELRSGKDILFDVATAFQDLDQNQKLFVTQQLVGIEQSARMVEVFDGLSKSTEITAVAMNAAGSAAKEVAARLQDPEVAVNRLVESIKNLASAVGDEFQQSGTDVINGFTDIFAAVEKAVGAGTFDPILDSLNDFLGSVADNLQAVASNIPEALSDVDFSGFVDSLESLKDTIAGLFDGIDFNDPESLAQAIQKVVDTIESLVNFSEGMANVFVEVAGYIGSLVDWFNSLDAETKQTAGTITAIGAVISALTGPIGSLTAAFSGIGNAMNALAASQVANLAKSLIGTGGLSAAFTTVIPLAASFAGGFAIGDLIRAAVPAVDDLTQSFFGLVDKYTGLIGVEEEHQRVQQEAVAVEERWKQVMEQRAAAAEEASAKDSEYFLSIIDAAEDAGSWTDYLTESMRKLGILVEEPKKVSIDTQDAVEKLQTLEYYRESTGTWETIKVPVDTSAVDKAKEEIEEIPAVKRLEIETDLEIAKVKSQAETAQAALKLKAEVDIAEIEAAAEVTKSVAKNISEMFADTGDTLTDLLSMFGNDTTIAQDNAIYRAISEEQENRKKLLEQQQALSDAQVAYLKEKTERLKSGESLITVNGDGLQPHLEYIMWELFEAIQIRATQEGLDQLLLGGAS